MKQDWTVKGTIVYRDGSPDEGFSGTWPGLTLEEADARADEFVAEQMRRREGVAREKYAALKRALGES